MEKFEGFTEDDIKNLTLQKNTNLDEKPVQNKTVSGTAVSKLQPSKSRYQNRLSRKNVARERLLKGNLLSSYNEGLPKEARLFIHQVLEEEDETDSSKAKQNTTTFSNSVAPDVCKQNRLQNNETENEDAEPKRPGDVDVKNTTFEDRNKEMEENVRRKTSLPVLNSEAADEGVLEEFETRQKLIKEQNRQRKEILKQALADRAKKTHEEVKRLNEIEGELKKLDVLLSNDVAIIRNQIETASIDFMEAQKRYDRAEKEFLDAKLDLFNKKERKELLTSHLCTIIEQNEMRKAKKLSALMVQLEVGPKASLMTSQITVEYKTEEQEDNKNQILSNNSDEQENNKDEPIEIKNESVTDK